MQPACPSDKDGPDGAAQFTRRQLEILALLKAGKANKEIAHQLGIGVGTVKQHVVALFKKLKVTNRAMAVSRGWDLGDSVHGGGRGEGSGRASPCAAAPAPGDVSVELRPVVVLSLQAEPAEPAWTAQQALQSAAGPAVAGLGAVLVVPPDGGLDLIFGLQSVGDDDALKAIAVARTIAEAVAASGDMRLRAGLSAGFAVGSMNRFGGWTGESVAGRVIGEARSLRQGAAPGRMAVGERARQLIDCAARGHDTPPLPAGESEMALSAASAGRGRGRRARQPLRLFGRAQARDTVDAALADLAGGRGGVLAIRGEVGMGKTNLGLHLAARCDERALRCLHHRCAEAGSTLPGTIDGAMRRRHADGDIVASIAVAARRKPVCLIVDDADRIGPDDTVLLRRLMDETRRLPLLVVLTGRPSRLAPLVEGTGCTAIQLGRLEPEAARQIVLAECGRPLPSERVSDILELATGVPLFAVELARQHRGGAGDEVELPLTCASVVMARIDQTRLDRAMLRLLARRHRSGAGEVSVAELAGQWPGTPDELDSRIERAVRYGVLVLSPDGTRVSFSHPMIAAVLQRVLLPDWSPSPEPGLPLSTRAFGDPRR